ncbi:MAG: family 43 glycosylhydrolase [Myxococcales bacterium]|nr:family 43 glycosylhydrolase [Myxococcales bacterium]
MRATPVFLCALVALGSWACGGGRPDAGVDVTWSGFTPDASVEPPAVPVVAGEFTRVLVPDNRRYLNDHTIVFDPSARRWHVFGITDTSEASPHEETEFLHASADSLLGPWRIDPDVMHVDRGAGEHFVWAPHVIGSPGAWQMFFTSSVAETTLATSADLYQWTRPADWRDRSVHPTGGRDPMVLKLGDRWLVYSVYRREAPEGTYGQIVVSESRDQRAWTAPRVVLEEPGTSYDWGNLESPFVVERNGGYYLFVTRTDVGTSAYHRTVVFYSTSPERFTWAPITEFWAHCAEVIRDGDRWYVSSGGWTLHTGERWRGLLLAPLRWMRPE